MRLVATLAADSLLTVTKGEITKVDTLMEEILYYRQIKRKPILKL